MRYDHLLQMFINRSVLLKIRIPINHTRHEIGKVYIGLD